MFHRNLCRSIAMAATALGLNLSAANAATVWINEFHYENAGQDQGEFVEIAGVAGTDLTSLSLYFYNGSNGTLYRTEQLYVPGVSTSTVLTDQDNGFGFAVVNLPTNGMQNGSPDGIALVDNSGSGSVIEFLSYEGTFTALGGPANGMTSTLVATNTGVGVAEGGATPVGFSLQRAGFGNTSSDFTWVAAMQNTSGATNTGQSFGAIVDPDPVPLPPAMALFGAAGILLFRRRKA